MKISVKVKPNARQAKVEEIGQNSFVVWVKAKPVEGKANQAVIKALADHFHLPQSAISLLKGQTFKEKLFEISL
ncbi:MAG: DUF167 domain-containing protein [Candidatus Omnitrophica bacterium]|nr:DUF167 domain-containing protein [Candidatus Omnitrophota bacterium]MDD5236054.1 DUF167 domain-containing protein [Candidatus Omnitrophota bacterium]MDD5609928.1 DUF167 domain-containing protein [Candidatus Omnitrophota bacterium]